MRKMNISQYIKMKKWCQKHGWTEISEMDGIYYAFRPGAFIPEPIPIQCQLNPYYRILILSAKLLIYLVAWALISFAEVWIGREIGSFSVTTTNVQQLTALSSLISHKQPAVIMILVTWMIKLLQYGYASASSSQALRYVSLTTSKSSIVTILIILFGIAGVAMVESMKILLYRGA